VKGEDRSVVLAGYDFASLEPGWDLLLNDVSVSTINPFWHNSDALSWRRVWFLCSLIAKEDLVLRIHWHFAAFLCGENASSEASHAG
jgi:hypothetical protein